MPKLVLSTFVLLMLSCGLSMANECKAPRLTQSKITYEKPLKGTSPVIFSKYKININNPTLTIFGKDILIYIYGEGNNRKTLSIQPLPNTLEDSNNKYNATQAYKLAFGLDNKETTDDYILNLRHGFQLCNAEVTQYPFTGINIPIVKTNIKITGKNDTAFFVFNNTEPYIDMIQFANFTDEEIKQVMSTFQFVNKRN